MTTPPPPPKVKWALVTGCSSGGLGEALSLAFLSHGINVLSTAPDFPKTVQHISPDPGSQHGFLIRVRLDVTSSKSIYQACALAQELANGKLDFLVNNAGFGYYSPLLDVDIEKAKAQFDVNVWGVLQVTQAFFPMLRSAKGIVVNQASVAGLAGFNRPFMGIYSSSKAALLSLTDVMRLEFEPFDVRVVAAVTSAVKTEFARNAKGGAVVVVGRDGKSRSLYESVREDVEKCMREGMETRKGHDRHVLARDLVEVLLKEEPPMVVRNGYMAMVIWLLHWLLPMWMLDMIHRRGSGLDKLKVIAIEDASKKID